jgi:hypothetical protein
MSSDRSSRAKRRAFKRSFFFPTGVKSCSSSKPLQLSFSFRTFSSRTCNSGMFQFWFPFHIFSLKFIFSFLSASSNKIYIGIVPRGLVLTSKPLTIHTIRPQAAASVSILSRTHRMSIFINCDFAIQCDACLCERCVIGGSAGAFQCVWEMVNPADVEPIIAGQVFVAPPNRHLVVRSNGAISWMGRTTWTCCIKSWRACKNQSRPHRHPHPQCQIRRRRANQFPTLFAPQSLGHQRPLSLSKRPAEPKTVSTFQRPSLQLSGRIICPRLLRLSYCSSFSFVVSMAISRSSDLI